jgi:acyl dehydratase
MTAADALARQRYYEDVSIGDEYEEHQQPTPEHVATFLSTEGRGRLGRFTDASVARSEGLARPIVPGTMSTAIITRIVTDWMGPLGRIVNLEVSFRRPVMHNDSLRCLAIVTDAGGDAPDGEPGLITLDVTLENDRDEKPVQGTATVELPRRG